MTKVETLQSRNLQRLVLPKRVCSFDIETERKKGEKARLLLAGLVVYILHEDKYFPSRYRAFHAQDLSSLILFLKEFKGIIVGHNIFEFDYKILKYECWEENIGNRLRCASTGDTCPSELDLEGIIEKSVDTLWFACRQKGSRGGLSLKNLVRRNLKRAVKGTVGRTFARYWHHGHREKALAYNKNDCVITHKLWWQMVQDRQLFFEVASNHDISSLSITERDQFFSRMDRRFQIRPSEAQYLTGQRRMFNYRQWEIKLYEGILPTNCEEGKFIYTPAW